MRKTRILFIMLIFLLSSALNVAAQEGDICVMYGGERIEFDVPPYYSSGRIMAPIRAVHEAFGASVSWDDASESATSVLNGDSLKMTLGSRVYLVNGQEYTMDAAVEKRTNRIFAPVRYVASGFGKKISYHEYSQTAVISDVNEYSWYFGLTEPIPEFSSVAGAEFVSQAVLSDGTTEYSYIASENSLSDYLNYLQLDFGMEPYGMQYVAGGVTYIYARDDMLVSITELFSGDESRMVKLIPDAYGVHSISDDNPVISEDKLENEQNVAPQEKPDHDLTPDEPSEDVFRDESAEIPKDTESDESISYDDVDYGKITKSKLLEEYTNEGKTFYVYSYDIFSESYYESYIESQGWSFYDFRFDIDSFSNSKYWVKGENMLCISVNHMYNIVIICVM